MNDNVKDVPFAVVTVTKPVHLDMLQLFPEPKFLSHGTLHIFFETRWSSSYNKMVLHLIAQASLELDLRRRWDCSSRV